MLQLFDEAILDNTKQSIYAPKVPNQCRKRSNKHYNTMFGSLFCRHTTPLTDKQYVLSY